MPAADWQAIIAIDLSRMAAQAVQRVQERMSRQQEGLDFLPEPSEASRD